MKRRRRKELVADISVKVKRKWKIGGKICVALEIMATKKVSREIDW